jgi:hypothetical protein
MGFIGKEILLEQARVINNQYGEYLLRLVDEEFPFDKA